MAELADAGRFAGTVALVTGAARPRGIGRALRCASPRAAPTWPALDLAKPYDEAPTHGTASGDDLDSVVAEIQAPGSPGHRCGPTCPARTRWRRRWPRPTAALGTINAVANVAGGSGIGFGVGPLLNVAVDEFRRVLDVNLVGTWLVSKATAQRMVDAKVPGRICNVSSQAGKRAFPMLGAYCAAKSGVILPPRPWPPSWARPRSQ